MLARLVSRQTGYLCSIIVRRQQLAEVIAKHNQVLSEREEEIIRASSVELTDDEEQASRSFKTSSGSNMRKKFHKKVGILQLYTD